MKKIILVILGLVLTFSAHADNSKIEVRGSVDDGTTTISDTGLITKYFGTGAQQQQTISLTASTFTNISVPSGAKAVLINVLSADGIKLKGITGDEGISLDSACPVLMPLSTDGTVTLGIQNMETSAQTIKVYFY